MFKIVINFETAAGRRLRPFRLYFRTEPLNTQIIDVFSFQICRAENGEFNHHEKAILKTNSLFHFRPVVMIVKDYTFIFSFLNN